MELQVSVMKASFAAVLDRGTPRIQALRGWWGEPVPVQEGMESVWMGSSSSCHSGEARL